MNILFLDVDGVLNSQTYLLNKYYEKGKDTLTREEFIDPECMHVLKKIVNLYDFQIVLISSWKNIEKNYILLKNIFSKYDLHILDRTKNYGGERGKEIKDWIKNNNVRNYVVLDDEVFYDYERYKIRKHLVQTGFFSEHALSDMHVKRVIEIMNETKL